MSCLFYRAAGRSREERAEGKYKSRAIECVDYPPPISLVRFTRKGWGGASCGWQDAAPDIPDGLGFGWGFGGCAIFKHPIPPSRGDVPAVACCGDTLLSDGW